MGEDTTRFYVIASHSGRHAALHRLLLRQRLRFKLHARSCSAAKPQKRTTPCRPPNQASPAVRCFAPAAAASNCPFQDRVTVKNHVYARARNEAVAPNSSKIRLRLPKSIEALQNRFQERTSLLHLGPRALRWRKFGRYINDRILNKKPRSILPLNSRLHQQFHQGLQ